MRQLHWKIIYALLISPFFIGLFFTETPMFSKILLAAGGLAGLIFLFRKSPVKHLEKIEIRILKKDLLLLFVLLAIGIAITLSTYFESPDWIPLCLFALGLIATFFMAKGRGLGLEKKEWLVIFFLFSASLIAYSIFLNIFPAHLADDETNRGIESLNVLSGKGLFEFGWYGLPRLSFLTQAASIAIFGKDFWGLRMASAIVGALAAFPFYLLIKELFNNKKVALLATVIFLFGIGWLAVSRLGMDYNHAVFLGLLALAFLIRGLKASSLKLICFGGIFAGLEFSQHWSGWIYIFICLLVLFSYFAIKSLRFKQLIKSTFVLLISFFFSFSLIFGMALREPQEFFLRVNLVSATGNILATQSGQKDWNYFINQVISTENLITSGKDNSDAMADLQYPLVPLLTLPLLGFGIFFAGLYPAAAILMLLLSYGFLFAGATTVPAPWYPRLVGLLIPLSAFCAISIYFFSSYLKKIKIRETIAATLLVSVAAVPNCLNYYLNASRFDFITSTEPDTPIIRYIQSMGKDYYYIILPAYYMNLGHWGFFLQDYNVNQDSVTEDVIPLQESGKYHKAIYIFKSYNKNTDYQWYFDKLEKYYPSGSWQWHNDQEGHALFATFLVSDSSEYQH